MKLGVDIPGIASEWFSEFEGFSDESKWTDILSQFLNIFKKKEESTPTPKPAIDPKLLIIGGTGALVLLIMAMRK